jgi:hypothetical protein
MEDKRFRKDVRKKNIPVVGNKKEHSNSSETRQ